MTFIDDLVDRFAGRAPATVSQAEFNTALAAVCATRRRRYLLNAVICWAAGFGAPLAALLAAPGWLASLIATATIWFSGYWIGRHWETPAATDIPEGATDG